MRRAQLTVLCTGFLIFIVLLTLISFFPPHQAHASFNVPHMYDRSISVGASSVAILPAESNRKYLLIENVCSGQNIGINQDAATAAIGSAGTITLFPGGSLEFKGSDVPDNAFTAISASGTCAITIKEIQ